MEETLTVVKLALPELLRKSLATTNAIENLNGTIRRVSIYRKFNISFLRDFGNESATVNPTCDKPRGFGHPRFSFAPREGRLLDSGAGESRSRGGKSLGDEGSETAGQAGACSESVDISETEGATATPRPAS